MVRSLLLLPLLALALPAHAQEDGEQAPRRYRVTLGAQVSPYYPGSDSLRISPLVDAGITRGDKPFAFEAADESFAVPIINDSGFQIGPALALQGARRRERAGAAIDEVGVTVEAGGYAQFWIAPRLRFHGEVRQGINGHRGLIGNAGLDYVLRDGDKWLFALGPRVTLSNEKYRRAYFEVTPAAAARTGLPVYHADGSAVHAIGATATSSYQFTPRWGVYGYAKYDRLTGDAADSPITQALGSRNQFSGGLGLSFTFGKGVR
jgi:outer membrane scaffolding protein for murein synthesis (MipA/OmpV family)